MSCELIPQCIARMHHSAHAHYRRVMFMDEETFPKPAVLDYSNCHYNWETVEAHTKSSADELAMGRDTVVARNLSSIEKSAAFIHSVGSDREVRPEC